MWYICILLSTEDIAPYHIGDEIKQNESEVEKYDFCFFGIFY